MPTNTGISKKAQSMLRSIITRIAESEWRGFKTIKEVWLEKEEQEKMRRILLQAGKEKKEIAQAQKDWAVAKKGLLSLIEIGTHPAIQELIDSKIKRSKRVDVGLRFYSTSRYAGDTWDMDLGKDSWANEVRRKATEVRSACIFLYSDRIALNVLANRGGEFIEVLYDKNILQDEEKFASWFSSGDCSKQDPIKALEEKQYTYAWDPEKIIGKVLMDCANKQKRERYLFIALANERKKV